MPAAAVRVTAAERVHPTITALTAPFRAPPTALTRPSACTAGGRPHHGRPSGRGTRRWPAAPAASFRFTAAPPRARPRPARTPGNEMKMKIYFFDDIWSSTYEHVRGTGGKGN